jgi:hypothetical protein
VSGCSIHVKRCSSQWPPSRNPASTRNTGCLNAGENSVDANAPSPSHVPTKNLSWRNSSAGEPGIARSFPRRADGKWCSMAAPLPGQVTGLDELNATAASHRGEDRPTHHVSAFTSANT